MTECIYGILKRRFPIIKHIRNELPNAILIVQACTVLHNIALDWKDDVPNDHHSNYDDDDDDNDDLDVPQDQLHIFNMLSVRERREQGMNARDNWRISMDNNPTRKELEKMTRHRVEAEARQRARCRAQH